MSSIAPPSRRKAPNALPQGKTLTFEKPSNLAKKLNNLKMRENEEVQKEGGVKDEVWRILSKVWEEKFNEILQAKFFSKSFVMHHVLQMNATIHTLRSIATYPTELRGTSDDLSEASYDLRGGDFEKKFCFLVNRSNTLERQVKKEVNEKKSLEDAFFSEQFANQKLKIENNFLQKLFEEAWMRKKRNEEILTKKLDTLKDDYQQQITFYEQRAIAMEEKAFEADRQKLLGIGRAERKAKEFEKETKIAKENEEEEKKKKKKNRRKIRRNKKTTRKKNK